MGLFDRFKRPKAASTAGSRYTFTMGMSTAGEDVTQLTAMQQSAVYACVRVLAESIASLPLHLYKTDTKGKRERAKDDPLYWILNKEPNKEMSAFNYWETVMTHLLLWGNSYSQIIRTGRGENFALYPLIPENMSVKRDDKGEIYYKYLRQDSDEKGSKGQEYQEITFKSEDIFHIPGLGFDGLVGYSPIAMAKSTIGLSLACENYGSSFFANGATPGGILSFAGTVSSPDRIRESWKKGFGGRNSNKVAVLEEGASYKQVSIAPEQAQFLETRKFQINEIARIFRVPPHLIADLEQSSFSNIEQQSLEFVKYTLTPWMARIEQAVDRKLLPEGKKKAYYAKFNADAMLRGDYQTRMQGYAIARQNGIMSTNDIRRLEDMDLVDAELGGDRYLINGNMMGLEQAGEQYMKEGGKE